MGSAIYHTRHMTTLHGWHSKHSKLSSKQVTTVVVGLCLAITMQNKKEMYYYSQAEMIMTVQPRLVWLARPLPLRVWQARLSLAHICTDFSYI